MIITKQSGNGAVVALISVLIVVAVGFTGFYVYNTQKGSSNDPAQGTQATSSRTEKAATNSEETKQTDTQKYLVIKEWGVKLPLTDEISDLQYTYNAYTENAKGGEVSLHSKKLVDAGCGEDGANGVLIRTPEKSDSIGVLVKTDSNNYYYYMHAQSACMNSKNADDPILKTQLSTNAAITKSVNHIQ